MTDATPLTLAPDGLRFGIGRSLLMSFGVLGRNFGPMALIAVVITAIQSVVDLVLSGDPTGGEGSGSSVLGAVTYAFITAPMTYATFQDLRGTRVGVGEMMSRGFGRVVRVMFTSLVVGLAIMVPIVVAVVVGMIAIPLLYPLLAAAGLGVLYIIVIWFVAVPVQVMESGGFGAGFKRAADLSRGHRWGILGLLLIYAVLIIALFAAVLAAIDLIVGHPIIVLLFYIPLGAFSSAMGAILPAVVYFLLRAEKEGVGIDEIAKVFD